MWSAWQLRQCASFLGLAPSEILLRAEFHEKILIQQGISIVEANHDQPSDALRGIALLRGSLLNRWHY